MTLLKVRCDAAAACAIISLAGGIFSLSPFVYAQHAALAPVAVAASALEDGARDTSRRQEIAKASNNAPRVLGECPLDVDGDGRVLPSDVLLAMRAALGIKGAPLVSDITFAANATRTSDTAVSGFLAGNCGTLNCGLDLDGDTRVRATNDLLAAMRIAFRVRDNVALDATVLNGVNFASNAPRNTWNAIRDYLIDCRDVNPNPPKVGGALYLPVGGFGSSATGGPSELSFTQTAGGIVSDSVRNSRFAFATYSVQNNSASTLNELCFVAINAAGNLGGTAIYSVTNFAGAGLNATQFARSSKPAHKMIASGNTSVIDNSAANLRLIAAAETSAGSCGGGGTLLDGGNFSTPMLEYGFGANEASIASGASGTVTIAYRLPSNNADDTSLTASFFVVKNSSRRVSQSREETVSQVNARATASGASEVAYSGPTAASAVPPGNIFAIRLADPKISSGNSAATLYGP